MLMPMMHAILLLFTLCRSFGPRSMQDLKYQFEPVCQSKFGPVYTYRYWVVPTQEVERSRSGRQADVLALSDAQLPPPPLSAKALMLTRPATSSSFLLVAPRSFHSCDAAAAASSPPSSAAPAACCSFHSTVSNIYLEAHGRSIDPSKDRYKRLYHSVWTAMYKSF